MPVAVAQQEPDIEVPSVPGLLEGVADAPPTGAERPRLVAGVEAAHHTTRRGVPYVVVHSPATHAYLRLGPAEFALLPLLDGSRTLAALVLAWYERRGTMAPGRVVALLEALRAHGFLVDCWSGGASRGAGESDAIAPPAPGDALASRVRRGGGWMLRARALRAGVALLSGQRQVAWAGADAFLGACYRAFGWLLFTRAAALLGGAVALLGALAWAATLARGSYNVFDPLHAGGPTPLALALLGGAAWVGLALHELGHGLAVKHAGRSVWRAGAMLYLGLPAAFVDTSDVWLAPPRARLVASLAGPAAELVLGGACGLAAALLPEGPGGALAFAAGGALLLGGLLQLCPLLELDGYYVLVDLLEQPMLRPRALAFARGPLWDRLRRRERLTREERWLAAFGLASLATGAVALALAAWTWHRWLAPWLVPALAPLARLASVAAGGGAGL